MKPLFVILAILVTLLAIGWLAADTSVSLAQSRAVIEAAQAAQESARAAQIASAGNVVMGSGMTVILVVLVLVGANAVAVYFYLHSKEKPKKRVVIRPRVVEEEKAVEALPVSSADPIEQLTRLVALEMMSRMSERQAAQPPRLPGGDPERRW